MKDILSIFKILSSESRLRILLMLRVRPLCVCEINEVLDIALSTISQQLKLMENTGLIENTKDGRWVIYKIVRGNSYLNKLLKELEQNLKQDPKIMKDRVIISQITREACALKLKERQKK